MFRLITLGCFVLSIFLAIGTTAFSATNNNYEITQIISVSKNVANMS